MPGRTNRFIDPKVFAEIIERIPKRDGEPYDGDAVDGMLSDLSRLVVALLATKDESEIQALYTQLGWAPNIWSRALHRAAYTWCMDNKIPEKLKTQLKPPK